MTADALPDVLRRTDIAPADVGRELLQHIETAIWNHPRSLQEAIGPSGVGHPCARRIGYQLLHQPENQGEPNWKATIGTALHAWLEGVMDAANLEYEQRTRSGQERFYTEQRVDVGDYNGTTVYGSCDLYDRVTASVWDWKSTGPTLLAKYRKNGPGVEYRAQAHLYGRGWQRRGLPVASVGCIFLPRNGELREAYVWHEPYDEQVAVDALERLAGIDTAASVLGHGALEQLPTADAWCTHCPFFRAGSSNLTLGCPGHPTAKENTLPDPNEPAFGPVN